MTDGPIEVSAEALETWIERMPLLVPDALHSHRKAVIGSTRLARHAGT